MSFAQCAIGDFISAVSDFLNMKNIIFLLQSSISWWEKLYIDEHALKVWNAFEMKTMKDYPDLYFKCNVLLLADVFEKCRNNNLEKHGLCPSHHLSAPALN